MRCKRGRHACDKTNVDKILSEAGLYWFCDECNQQFKLEYLNKLDKNAHFKGFKGAKENNEKEKVKDNENEKKEDTAKIKDKKTKESEKTSPGDIDIPDEIPKQIINKDQKKEYQYLLAMFFRMLLFFIFYFCGIFFFVFSFSLSFTFSFSLFSLAPLNPLKCAFLSNLFRYSNLNC